MATIRDRILIVENDPEISELIGRQALQAAGYQTFVASDVNTAISKAVQLAPDVIIADLILPGLSGKDLLVALSSQGIETPVIILAPKGLEADVIQTFRLGASDYLLWPSREAEVVNAVERVLKQVRDRRDRERLARQLRQTNQELQQRVRELTTIFSVGKAVTSITDQNLLFEKILEGAIKVTQADLGWFMLREDTGKAFLLAAVNNLPASLNVRLHQPWDDGISSLVAMSGEPLALHGDPLKRFKILSLGQSALVVPIKGQKTVIGLLIVMRKQPSPFSDSEQHLLEAVADYASISLVNARLFRALEERVHAQQTAAENAVTGGKIANSLLLAVRNELRQPLDLTRAALDRLTKDPTARWNAEQRQSLTVLLDEMQYLSRITEAIAPIQISPTSPPTQACNLSEVIRQSVNRFQHFAQQNSITISAVLPTEPFTARADGVQIGQVLDGLLSHSIKICNPGGQVTILVEKGADATVHITLSHTGSTLDGARLQHIFEEGFTPEISRPRRFGGLSISLNLVQEIVNHQNGKIWADSKTGQGSSFHITLPSPPR